MPHPPHAGPHEAARRFAGLSAPGYAKAAMNFRIEAQETGCRLSTETRVAATDPASRRRFALYWAAVRPGSGLLRRTWPRAIARRAEFASLRQLALASAAAALLLGAAGAPAQQPASSPTPTPTPTPTPSPASELPVNMIPPIPGIVVPPIPDVSALKAIDPATPPPSFVKDRKGELLWAPIPISNPTVGTGLGLAGAYLFPIEKSDDVSPPTLAALGGLYTSSGTWAVVAVFKTYLKQDTWRVLGVVTYGNVKTDYFGIGTPAGDTGTSTLLHQEGSYILLEGLRRVLLKDLYAGLRYQRADISTETPPDAPPEIVATLPGTSFSTTSAAAGLRIQYDTRDNTFYATRGAFVDATSTFAARWLGGDQTYQKYSFGVNGYFPLREKLVLGARAYVCGVGGDAPYYGLCLFGSSDDIRGYKSGQYRDRGMVAAQAELRVTLPKKFGAVAFFGLGEVAPGLAHLRASDLLVGGGLGVRYRVTKQDPINLRVDYAWGKGGGSLYVGVGEAF